MSLLHFSEAVYLMVHNWFRLFLWTFSHRLRLCCELMLESQNSFETSRGHSMDGSQLGFHANRLVTLCLADPFFKIVFSSQKGLSCRLLFNLLYMLKKAVCPLEYVVTGVWTIIPALLQDSTGSPQRNRNVSPFLGGVSFLVGHWLCF